MSLEDDHNDVGEVDVEEKKEIKRDDNNLTSVSLLDHTGKRCVDPREHVNLVFIGHVDSGKSTISGQILLLTGQVDERTIAKYEKEAKEKNRESWYLAYILDTNEEERAKGKTVEVGRARFSTEKKRYTLLDAPGHKNYVPNMIGGASQADIGVLVISARKGEFESGFEKGGQTSEHAMLAKALGLQKLIVLVNKMDEKEVQWSQERYNQIETTLSPYLKKCGFNLSRDVTFLPASGFTGENIRDPVSLDVCPWYKEGKSLFQVFDEFPPLSRDLVGPVRFPILARYKDMGVLYCMGKLESGVLFSDQELIMIPTKIKIQCVGLIVDGQEVDLVKAGENVLIKIKGIEEEDLHQGYVLSCIEKPVPETCLFQAMIIVQDLLDSKPLITKGYECILHVHVLTVDCTINKILALLDKKTGQVIQEKPRMLRAGDMANVVIQVEESIAVELFQNHPTLGRIILRDQGKGIGVGKIVSFSFSPVGAKAEVKSMKS